jgi:hypothetical protein
MTPVQVAGVLTLALIGAAGVAWVLWNWPPHDRRTCPRCIAARERREHRKFLRAVDRRRDELSQLDVWDRYR